MLLLILLTFINLLLEISFEIEIMDIVFVVMKKYNDNDETIIINYSC